MTNKQSEKGLGHVKNTKKLKEKVRPATNVEYSGRKIFVKFKTKGGAIISILESLDNSTHSANSYWPNIADDGSVGVGEFSVPKELEHKDILEIHNNCKIDVKKKKLTGI